MAAQTSHFTNPVPSSTSGACLQVLFDMDFDTIFPFKLWKEYLISIAEFDDIAITWRIFTSLATHAAIQAVTNKLLLNEWILDDQHDRVKELRKIICSRLENVSWRVWYEQNYCDKPATFTRESNQMGAEVELTKDQKVKEPPETHPRKKRSASEPINLMAENEVLEKQRRVTEWLKSYVVDALNPEMGSEGKSSMLQSRITMGMSNLQTRMGIKVGVESSIYEEEESDDDDEDDYNSFDGTISDDYDLYDESDDLEIEHVQIRTPKHSLLSQLFQAQSLECNEKSPKCPLTGYAPFISPSKCEAQTNSVTVYTGSCARIQNVIIEQKLAESDSLITYQDASKSHESGKYSLTPQSVIIPELHIASERSRKTSEVDYECTSRGMNSSNNSSNALSESGRSLDGNDVEQYYNEHNVVIW